jgi:hypothetical protein
MQTAAFSILLPHPALAAQAKKQFSLLAGYDAVGLADLIRRKQVSTLELIEDVVRCLRDSATRLFVRELYQTTLV